MVVSCQLIMHENKVANRLSKAETIRQSRVSHGAAGAVHTTKPQHQCSAVCHTAPATLVDVLPRRVDAVSQG